MTSVITKALLTLCAALLTLCAVHASRQDEERKGEVIQAEACAKDSSATERNGPKINPPAGCKAAQLKCGDHSDRVNYEDAPAENILLSGRGEWYWTGHGCNPRADRSENLIEGAPALEHAWVGETMQLVDDGIVVAEHTIESTDLFVQVLPCHKKTVDINCAEEFVGKVPSIGMHVLCFSHGIVCAYRDGSGLCELLEGEDLTTVEKIAVAMGLRTTPHQKNRMRFYATDGTWVQSTHDHDALLMFEGGTWMWPTMEIGYSREIQSADGTMHLITKSLVPAVFEIAEPLMDQGNIDNVLNQTQGYWRKSSVISDEDGSDILDPIRTSSSAYLNSMDDELIKFHLRAQSIVRLPLTRAEHMQVIKYAPGEYYKAHSDAKGYSSEETSPPADRVATLFLTFNPPAKGGATGFPKARVEPNVNEWDDDCGHFQMPAEKGKGILFYSLLPNGFIDTASLHVGCEVKEGKKIAGNFWFWNGYQEDRPRQNSIYHSEPQFMDMSMPYFNDGDMEYLARGQESKLRKTVNRIRNRVHCAKQ